MSIPIRTTVIALICAAIITLAFSVRRVLGKDVIKSPTTMPSAGSTDHPAGPIDFAVKDIDGKQPPSGRAYLGAPSEFTEIFIE